MAVFDLFNGKNDRFSVNPKVVKAVGQKGWVIAAYSDDRSLYGGLYVKTVGFAHGSLAIGKPLAFRLKAEALADMKAAIADGTLKVEA